MAEEDHEKALSELQQVRNHLDVARKSIRGLVAELNAYRTTFNNAMVRCPKCGRWHHRRYVCSCCGYDHTAEETS